MAICRRAGRIGSTGVWIARLLAVAFALRALVPVGFMPDFAAARNGEFKVVICTVHGMVTVEVDDSGKLLPGKTDGKIGQQCTFGALGALVVPTLDGMTVSAQFVVAAAIPPLAVELPPTRAGPQLGSRGPPTLS